MNGDADLTIVVSDPYQAEAYAQFNIFIEPVNDLPIIEAMADTSVDEDQSLAIAINATDVDNDYLSITATSDTTSWDVFAVDTYVFSDGDSLMMVPANDWNGSTQITVSVDDGSANTVETSFELTVHPVDDDPFVDGYLEDVYFYEDFGGIRGMLTFLRYSRILMVNLHSVQNSWIPL